MDKKQDIYTAGQLARMLNLTVRTVRYYKEIGVIKPVADKPKGKALFNHEAVSILKKVNYLKNSGCTLREAEHILKALASNRTGNKELTLFIRETISQSYKKVLEKERELKQIRIDMGKLLEETEACVTCKPSNPGLDCKGCGNLVVLKSLGVKLK